MNSRMPATATLFNLPPLTASERLLLAQKLIDSVLVETMPLSEVQIDEVRFRATAIDVGEANCTSVDEVLDRLVRAA
jgi:hypothetical protein